jgi:hypothetical protein
MYDEIVTSKGFLEVAKVGWLIFSDLLDNLAIYSISC